MLTKEEHRLYKLMKAKIKTWDNLNKDEFKIMINLNKRCSWMFDKQR